MKRKTAVNPIYSIVVFLRAISNNGGTFSNANVDTLRTRETQWFYSSDVEPLTNKNTLNETVISKQINIKI